MKKFSLHLLPALVLALATRAAAVEFTFSPSGSQPYDLADLAN